MSYPWHAWLLLYSPRRVAEGLERVRETALVPAPPNLWQIQLGVLRMWHRAAFRSETVGTCTAHPVRRTWRARLLAFRALRFPFLLMERAVAPWDMSGFLSGPDRIVRHLLGAHHDETQFIYDLQMLTLHTRPDGSSWLTELRRRLTAVLERDDARSRWLRDLTVHERYHENLMAGLDAFEDGAMELNDVDGDDPDISFRAYLSWCARQPATPAETWAAWRRGAFGLYRGRLTSEGDP